MGEASDMGPFPIRLLLVIFTLFCPLQGMVFAGAIKSYLSVGCARVSEGLRCKLDGGRGTRHNPPWLRADASEAGLSLKYRILIFGFYSSC